MRYFGPGDYLVVDGKTYALDKVDKETGTRYADVNISKERALHMANTMGARFGDADGNLLGTPGVSYLEQQGRGGGAHAGATFATPAASEPEHVEKSK